MFFRFVLKVTVEGCENEAAFINIQLFELPIQLKVNGAGLSGKFFELSRKYHPDYFINATEQERNEVLERSALLNKAFRTFQDQDATIKYVLQLKGLLEEEEKYELPPAFLMEVMEINEKVMDAQLSGNASETGSKVEPSVREEVLSSIEQLEKEIYEPVKEIVEHYKEGVSTEEELLQVKEYYYKKKYIDRIRKEIEN